MRGKGSHIWDADGNEYIDYVGSWGPLILGHAHPEVVEAVERLIEIVPAKHDAGSAAALDAATSTAPWRIYNIGNNRTVEVPRVVELLEKEFGRKAKIELLPMQAGDVPETRADIFGESYIGAGRERYLVGVVEHD